MATRTRPTAPPADNHALYAHEGRYASSAADALLKGLFESEREVSLLAVPRCDVFLPILRLASDASIASLLTQHGTAVKPTPDSRRALAMAVQRARSGRNAAALLSASELHTTARDLSLLARADMLQIGGLCFVIEDDPVRESGVCPRMLARRVGLSAVEVADIDGLRLAIEQALRLSRAANGPVAVIVHKSIFRSWETIEAHPNRALETVDVMIARRRRAKPRWTETRDLLRMARRLEINHTRALPSPGEVVPVGFITIGPTAAALLHVLHVLQLSGRVPVFQLGLIWPLDIAALSRFLERCEQVVVLEPQPGSVEQMIVLAAESMRHGEHAASAAPVRDRIASIWGRTLPVDAEGHQHQMQPDEAMHPSHLVRRIVHLLHDIRPKLQVASRLIPPPPPVAMTVSERGYDLGVPAARTMLKRSLADVDQWLRNQAPLAERGVPSTALAIEGVEPSISVERTIPVEIFEADGFADAGIAALRQASREGKPWIFIVLNFETHERIDVERLARGIVPGESTDRLHIIFADLNDRFSIREQLQEAVMTDRLTVLIVRDGPSPQHDLRAMERSLKEVDQFGFQHSQQVIRAADHSCLFPRQQEEQALRESRDPQGRLAMRTEMSFDHFSRPSSTRFRVKVQPLLEQIEVVRSKPPAWIWKSQVRGRPELPTPMHRHQPQWRMHLAGARGPMPGVVAEVLIYAGRNMGYDVSAVHDDTLIGPGRRAWTQVLYTRPAQEGNAPALAASIPFGEADLLLGVDGAETVRAVSPDESLQVAHESRTTTVVNVGRFTEENDPQGDGFGVKELQEALGSVTHKEHRMIEDYAAACRSWFQTDRLTDLALLGVAFQRGLIPVGLDAIEKAVQRIEQRGFGRSYEAFEFGRAMATERRLLSRPRDDAEEDLSLQMRRMVLMLRNKRFIGKSLAVRFERLLQQAILSMPGLSETTAGRLALRDFVTALYRCLEWGGFEYASRYAELIMTLYRSDSGEKGRAVTRDAILPLAEAMLIHDPIYIASMATSLEQRRRLRHALNVKNGRGDLIERRYLTRVELIAFDRRFRADVRTSDWPARIARLSRHFVPGRWRGTRRSRDIRDFLTDLVQRAGYGCAGDYNRWRDVMWRLHLQAADNRLRDMTLAEIKMLTSSEDEG